MDGLPQGQDVVWPAGAVPRRLLGRQTVDMSMNQYLTAIAMVVVALALVFAYRRYLISNSERRMRAMLDAVGLDPAIATSGDIPTIMKEVRQRCRHCKSEGLCERWLEGKEAGGNEFCPNHTVFEVLKKYSGEPG